MAARAPISLRQPKLLLGEGRDEVFFFTALLRHLSISGVQVEEYGGKAKLSTFVAALVLSPGWANVVSLAVTRDADADAAAAFQSVCGALAGGALAPPAAPGQSAGSTPRVGVFLLPDNSNPGMLEDLRLASVAADAAMPCVDDFFRCVAGAANRQPVPLAKARVHAWLASQLIPDRRLGEAALAGLWDWTDPAFAALRQFVTAL